MLNRKKQLEQLLKTINNIYENHPDVWGELSREAERLLNKSNHDIKHEFYNRLDPSDICPYLKSSMPRSALDEIDRTSRNISPFRGATMLIDKIFHYDESFYQFLIAMVKSKQGDLVESLLKNVGDNKPYLRQYILPEYQHRSLHTPPNTQHNSEVQQQGSDRAFSNPNTVDQFLFQPQTSPPSENLFSEPNGIDDLLRGQQQPNQSTFRSGVEKSIMNSVDQAAANANEAVPTIAGNFSAPLRVDVNIQQVLAENARLKRVVQQQAQQQQNLQQQYQQLRSEVVVVHRSMENFRAQVRNNIPHENAEPQAGMFGSEDFKTDN